jgi:hypothetical protein
VLPDVLRLLRQVGEGKVAADAPAVHSWP